MTINEIGISYGLACEEYKSNPRKNTQIWQYIRDICNGGILSTKIVSQGIKGRTTYVSLPDIPAKILVNEIEQILSNKLMKSADGR